MKFKRRNWKLGWSLVLVFFFLNMWCIYNKFISWMWILFQKVLFFLIHKKNRFDFLDKITFFLTLHKQIWYFLTKISFSLLHKNKSNLQTKSIFFIHETYLNFLEKEDIILKEKLSKLFFVMCVQHIIQHHAKKGILVLRV